MLICLRISAHCLLVQRLQHDVQRVFVAEIRCDGFVQQVIPQNDRLVLYLSAILAQISQKSCSLAGLSKNGDTVAVIYVVSGLSTRGIVHIQDHG